MDGCSPRRVDMAGDGCAESSDLDLVTRIDGNDVVEEGAEKVGDLRGRADDVGELGDGVFQGQHVFRLSQIICFFFPPFALHSPRERVGKEEDGGNDGYVDADTVGLNRSMVVDRAGDDGNVTGVKNKLMETKRRTSL